MPTPQVPPPTATPGPAARCPIPDALRRHADAGPARRAAARARAGPRPSRPAATTAAGRTDPAAPGRATKRPAAQHGDPQAQVRTTGARRRRGREARRRPRAATSTARRRSTTRPSRCRLPGAAPIGVPNFFIDKFRIPPFLLPIYQAAGIQYGIRWEVLAAINEIETDYGRNLNVSSAGAWAGCSSCPPTWKMYGVDANQDGEKDPYNPVDAIFAAARYLRAAGADQDLRRRGLRLQPRRLVRRLRAPARAGDRRAARRPRRLAHRPHAGPLPGRRQGDLRRRHLRARHQEASRQGQQRPSSSSPAPTAAASRSSRARARPWSPSTTGGSTAIGTRAPRPLRQAPGRLRQHVHVRAPGQGLEALPGAEAAEGLQARDPARARAARRATCRRPSEPRPREGPAARAPKARDRRKAVAAAVRKQAAADAEGARPARPARSACSPTRAAERGRRRRRAAGVRAHRPHRRHPDVPGLPAPRLRPRPQRRAPEALKKGSRVVAGTVLGRIGGRPRDSAPHRCSRSARPAAAPRGSTRSRSSTAGSCSSRPRSTAPRARTPFFGSDAGARRSARSC